jgi:hypothetical protein
MVRTTLRIGSALVAAPAIALVGFAWFQSLTYHYRPDWDWSWALLALFAITSAPGLVLAIRNRAPKTALALTSSFWLILVGLFALAIVAIRRSGGLP